MYENQEEFNRSCRCQIRNSDAFTINKQNIGNSVDHEDMQRRSRSFLKCEMLSVWRTSQ